jgi:hypothetical protein
MTEEQSNASEFNSERILGQLVLKVGVLDDRSGGYRLDKGRETAPDRATGRRRTTLDRPLETAPQRRQTAMSG